MVFNDTTNKNGIIQMIERTTMLGDGNISGNSGELAYFTELVNEWLQITHYYAWEKDKNWYFDDSNYTTFPIATTTLVNNQRDYSLPDTLLRIKSVEVMDANGKYYSLFEMANDSDVLWNEREQEPAGKPSHYRLEGFSVILYPKPDTSQLTTDKGLRIICDREMDFFAVSDTDQEPGLVSTLHPACYYGPSWVWAGLNNVPNVQQTCDRMLGQFPGIREIAQKHFDNRNTQDLSRIRSAKGKKSFK